MKKLIIAFLALAPLYSFAHGQSPIVYGGKNHPLEAITMTGLVNVPISVVEQENPEEFTIYADGKEYRTIHTQRGKLFKLSVPISADKPNVPETHHVCSVSSGKLTNNVSTEVCTTVQIYWKKNK